MAKSRRAVLRTPSDPDSVHEEGGLEVLTYVLSGVEYCLHDGVRYRGPGTLILTRHDADGEIEFGRFIPGGAVSEEE